MNVYKFKFIYVGIFIENTFLMRCWAMFSSPNAGLRSASESNPNCFYICSIATVSPLSCRTCLPCAFCLILSFSPSMNPLMAPKFGKYCIFGEWFVNMWDERFQVSKAGSSGEKLWGLKARTHHPNTCMHTPNSSSANLTPLLLKAALQTWNKTTDDYTYLDPYLAPPFLRLIQLRTPFRITFTAFCCIAATDHKIIQAPPRLSSSSSSMLQKTLQKCQSSCPIPAIRSPRTQFVTWQTRPKCRHSLVCAYVRYSGMRIHVCACSFDTVRFFVRQSSLSSCCYSWSPQDHQLTAPQECLRI